MQTKTLWMPLLVAVLGTGCGVASELHGEALQEMQPRQTASVEQRADAGSPGRFRLRFDNVAPWRLLKSGVFNTPVGSTGPGPILPGAAYEVTFTAGKSHRLSFVSMFGASNDWIVATPPEGIALFDGERPRTGDITSSIHVYDVGTEVDQEPGVGADTGPRQQSPDQGAVDPDPRVRELAGTLTLSDGTTTFSVPTAERLLRVTLTPTANANEFKLRIENCAGPRAFVTSAGPGTTGFSPGVFVVHGGGEPLFSLGQPDRGEGLEFIAEAGRITSLAAVANVDSGVATGFSPFVWVVHDGEARLYTPNESDYGDGLHHIAEDGNVSVLAANLDAAPLQGETAHGVVNTVVGGMGPGPLRPGNTFEVDVQATRGQHFSFASMYGASNDWFVDFGEAGLALFDEMGVPRSGDVSDELRLWDVGSEINQEPAVGADVGPNQSGPDTGAVDPDNRVRLVPRSLYATPLNRHLRVTVTPIS